MLIEHVLQRKGADVVTTPSGSQIKQVLVTFRDRNVGALVVSEGGDDVAGIISERDVVRALASRGSTVLDRPVRDVMTTEVTTCSPRSTVDQVMHIMTEQRIRHIPVMEAGHLAGIVSIGDVVKTRIDELQVEAETLHDYLTSGRI